MFRYFWESVAEWQLQHFKPAWCDDSQTRRYPVHPVGEPGCDISGKREANHALGTVAAVGHIPAISRNHHWYVFLHISLVQQIFPAPIRHWLTLRPDKLDERTEVDQILVWVERVSHQRVNYTGNNPLPITKLVNYPDKYYNKPQEFNAIITMIWSGNLIISESFFAPLSYYFPTLEGKSQIRAGRRGLAVFGCLN